MPGYAQFFVTSVNICVTSSLPVAGMVSVLVALQRVQVKVLMPVSVAVGSFVTLPLSHA